MPSLCSQGGGLFIESSAVVNMTDCSINENHALLNGGGMYILGAVNLVRCKVHDNVAVGAGEHFYPFGAGLYLYGYVEVTIIDSDIYQNRAASKVEYAFETRPKNINPITKHSTHDTPRLCLAGWRTRNIWGLELQYTFLPVDSQQPDS